MHDGGAQIRSFGIDIDRNLANPGVEPRISASSDKASDAGQPLGAAERLDILV